MKNPSVKDICQAWIDNGLGDEMFWESWPECPTPEDSLTPNRVMAYVEEIETKLEEVTK
jgi:hypothetical protein